MTVQSIRQHGRQARTLIAGRSAFERANPRVVACVNQMGRHRQHNRRVGTRSARRWPFASALAAWQSLLREEG